MNLKLNLFRNSVVDEINTESKRKEILTHERDSLNALIEQRTQCLKIPSEKMEEVSEIQSTVRIQKNRKSVVWWRTRDSKD